MALNFKNIWKYNNCKPLQFLENLEITSIDLLSPIGGPLTSQYHFRVYLRIMSSLTWATSGPRVLSAVRKSVPTF